MRYHAVVLVLAGVLAYATSFSNPFLYDDQTAIVKNATIRTLSPLSSPLSPPRDTPVAGRPLVNLSLAVNYAAGGLDVSGYHMTNVAFHVLTALLLFGIVRRTLDGSVSRSEDRPLRMGGLASHADGVAFAAALVWVVHPLNSEVVNYVVQRTESMMALCYLATIYCAIRATAPSERWLWRAAAIAACAAGMACKESMVTAPLMVLVYDRVFLYPSFGQALRERRALYIGLAATWVVLAALMLGQPRTSVGFDAGVTPWTYFLNQLPVIGRYLWLTVWPRSLAVDYGVPHAVALSDAVLPGLVLVALGGATLLALRRAPAVGFLGVWFFVTLAPTSSVVPIATEVGAERRMYLPLMALAVLAVVAVHAVIRRGAPSLSAGASAKAEGAPLRAPAILLTVVCVLLAAGTTVRTLEYRSVRTIAQTNVDRYPHGRARLALASELVAANEHNEAVSQLQEAVKDYPQAHLGLATEMATSGRMAEAVKEAQEFIRLLPGNSEVPTARDLMGRAYALQGLYDPAIEQFTLLTHARPTDPGPYVSIGDARLRQRRVEEAIASYESALRLRPGDPDILLQLGLALGAANRRADASIAFGGAAVARPTDIRLLNLWGRSLAAEGRYIEAVEPMRRLVELAPSDNTAKDNLRIMQQLATRQQAQQPGAGAALAPIRP